MVAEATITEVSIMDLPNDLVQGSSQKRRQLVAIRYTSAAATNTIALADYVPNIADVEGLMWDTAANAATTTSITWSTTTLSTKGTYDGECGVIVNLT